PSEVLVVFARFEAVNDVSLRPGECVEVDKIQQGVQTETNLDGQWIAGVLDRPSGLVVTIRGSDAESDEDKPVVFHLNSKAFPRWYYDWESGANKAQRLMKHTLKAYVMERVAVDMDDNFTTISSREAFTQLYRVLGVVSSPEFTVISYRRAPLDQLQAAQGQAAAQLAKEQSLRQVKGEPLALQVGAVAVSKNMALLLAFVRWAPVRLYAPFVDELVDSIKLKMLDTSPTKAKKTNQMDCFSRLLLQHAHVEENLRAAGGASLPFELETLLRVASQTVLWLFSPETLGCFREFFRQNAALVLDKKAVRSCFIRFLHELEEHLNAETAFPPRNAVERNWNGEWLLGVDEVQWDTNEVSSSPGHKINADARVPDVSLSSLVELMSQIVRFEVAIDIQERSLRVRVPQSLAGRLDCMHLVLDGKDRVFRMFPNGISSCAEVGALGDYFGEMRVEAPGQLVVFLETFNWSLEDGTPSYHVRSCIEFHRNGRLSVSGDILVTTGSSTFTAEEIPYVEEMTLRAKRKSVEKASARRYHAASAPKDIPVTPWGEYSRFRLCYRKV
ncbi:hypothetical protein JG688_00018518, partial [Phytophthora aleatoria]